MPSSCPEAQGPWALLQHQAADEPWAPDFATHRQLPWPVLSLSLSCCICKMGEHRPCFKESTCNRLSTGPGTDEVEPRKMTNIQLFLFNSFIEIKFSHLDCAVGQFLVHTELCDYIPLFKLMNISWGGSILKASGRSAGPRPLPRALVWSSTSLQVVIRILEQRIGADI